jgi:Sulfotransferase domain
MPMLMLWSVPRSRSTAFYRMMTERGDFTTVHEPFSRAEVFGTVDVGGRPLATGPEVIAELRSLAATRAVFIKDTTDRRHPAALADQRFLAEDAQHTFLIRHPRETIRSYLAVRRNPRLHEIGFEAQPSPSGCRPAPDAEHVPRVSSALLPEALPAAPRGLRALPGGCQWITKRWSPT